MKIGISLASVATVGLGLVLLTPSANAKHKQTFKVRSPRAAPLLAANTRTLANPAKHQSSNPAVGAPPEDVSPEAAEVVYLYHHGFRSDELLHYVNKSHADFKLTVSDVNYLEDIGIPTEVVVAMIRPAAARENVARLRQRLPGWASAALFGERKASQTPVMPQGNDMFENEPVGTDEYGNPLNYNTDQYGNPGSPNNNEPNHHHAYPPQQVYPYQYPYSVPYDRYRDYPGYGPFYDPYGGRTWTP